MLDADASNVNGQFYTAWRSTAFFHISVWIVGSGTVSRSGVAAGANKQKITIFPVQTRYVT